ncbi:AAA family ATPase [Jannaschia sp. Os4]|uniref:AAA family ATPase n=1 Tax=Jannaschia sp. Os4 TaxID=2807617 RepID=UPI001939615C|nr:AAA family ATPase [Jannaschia sp. Os4]MBM2578171.1 AAA family ATPase [Jannaschia sp. Os4]
MSNFSEASAGAVSPHARILRATLRDLVLRHATVGASDADPIDGLSIEELERGIDAAEKASPPSVPLAVTMAHSGTVPPLADEMDPEEIAACLARGDDPCAAGIDGVAPSPTPPVAGLLVTCRLARIFDGPEAIDAAMAPGALTVVTVPMRAARETVMDDLSALMPAFLRAGSRAVGLRAPEPDALPRVLMPGEETAQVARGSRRPSRSVAQLDDTVGRGLPAIVIVGGLDDLTTAARAVVSREVKWPILGDSDVVELLRATHSTTGQLSEDAIRAALPPAQALDALPHALWRRALAETSPLRAARQLAAFAEALPRPSGPTLSDLHVPPRVRNALDGLAADLRAWKAGRLAWTNVSPSLLFAGPPGTGKTLAAACIAGSADATFVSTSFADCQRYGHMGDYLAAMSDRVEEAIARTPSVFFLDELDSFGTRDPRARNGRYMAAVVNGLLEQLSRLHATPGVAVIGATNHPDRVDPAIVRAGRFDRHLPLDLPDRAGIEAILRSHVETAIGGGTAEIDIRSVASNLVGRSGADAAAVVRLAAGMARRRGDALNADDLAHAAHEIAPAHDAATVHATAVHEAGHVIVAAVLGLPLSGPARLTHRGGEVEVAMPALMTSDTVDTRLVALLAGRAAEGVLLGRVSHGAGLGEGSDLDRATDLALRAETEWGLEGSRLNTPVPRARRCELPLGVRRKLELRLAAADRRAREIVSAHRSDVLRIAHALRSERELSPMRLAELTAPLRSVGDDTVASSPHLAATLH